MITKKIIKNHCELASSSSKINVTLRFWFYFFLCICENSLVINPGIARIDYSTFGF
jgi:hypothetical protein